MPSDEVTYEIHTDRRTVTLEVGGSFARLPGEGVLAVRRIPTASTSDISAEEKRWFLATISHAADWTFSE